MRRLCTEGDKQMTEGDNQLIHAYVTDGKEYRSVLTSVCPDCEYEEWDNPDYSTRQHFPDLTDKLFGDERMYEAFEYHAGNAWAATGTKQFLIPWLFSDYARFVALFAEFLRLSSTIGEFGTEPCPRLKWTADKHACANETIKCEPCYSGKILKPWAKLVEEGK